MLDFDYLLAAKRATTFGGSGIHTGEFRVIRCTLESFGLQVGCDHAGWKQHPGILAKSCAFLLMLQSVNTISIAQIPCFAALL